MSQDKIDSTRAHSALMTRFPSVAFQRQEKRALSLVGKNITSDDLPLMNAYLKAEPEIVRLDLGNNQLSSIDGLDEEVKKRLIGLDIAHNQLNDAGAETLLQCTNLEYLSVNWNQIG